MIQPNELRSQLLEIFKHHGVDEHVHFSDFFTDSKEERKNFKKSTGVCFSVFKEDIAYYYLLDICLSLATRFGYDSVNFQMVAIESITSMNTVKDYFISGDLLSRDIVNYAIDTQNMEVLNSAFWNFDPLLKRMSKRLNNKLKKHMDESTNE